MDLAILGPGFPSDEESQHLAQELVRKIEKPLILSADWAVGIPGGSRSMKKRRAETVLIATLSQMSGITGESPEDLESNRIELLQRTASELGVIVVLEGAHSIIGCADENVYINLSGGGALARAGSSDVLSGTFAAMFDPRLPLTEIVRKGVFAHGLAADLAGKDNRSGELTAQGILDFLPLTVEKGWMDLEQPSRSLYAGGLLVL
jgi:NAD(P)H-hydrate epimerase